jgi:pimeloyl-ACP methyl ester carboxylesterase
VPAALKWSPSSFDITEIRQPVLLLEGGDGRKEGLLSRQVTECTRKLLPHAEFALIENANHMLPLQSPDAIGNVVADFLRRHSIKGASGSASP